MYRAQPLLRSLHRASKRAEKEAAEFGAPDTGAAALDEGTPDPPLPVERTNKQGLRADRVGSLSKARKGKRASEANGRAGSRNPSMPPPSKRHRSATSPQVQAWSLRLPTQNCRNSLKQHDIKIWVDLRFNLWG